MANKKITIEVDVDTKKVDDAVAKTGKLKDLGKGLKIQYDIDGKPVDIVIDKTLNLQKQVKLLTAELRRTKEGTAEFQLLSNRLNDTKDDLGRVTAKSNELFGTLSLLPGPIGTFSAGLQTGIDLLKTFSGFKLSDVVNQFKAFGKDVGEIAGNFLGLNKVLGDAAGTNAALSQSQNEVNGSVDDGKRVVEDAAIQNATYTKSQKELVDSLSIRKQKTDESIASVAELMDIDMQSIDVNSKAYKDARDRIMSQVAAYDAMTDAQKRSYVQGMVNRGEIELDADAINMLTTETETNIAAGETNAVVVESQTLATESLSVAQRVLTFTTEALSAAYTVLKSVLVGLGIGALIAGIIYLIENFQKVIDFITGATEVTKGYREAIKDVTKSVGDQNKNLIDVKNAFKEAKEGVKSKTEALKEYNDKLGATIGYAGSLKQAEDLLSANTDLVVQEIKLKTQANYFYAKSAELAAKAISGEDVDLSIWQKIGVGLEGTINGFNYGSVSARKMAENIKEVNDQSKQFEKEGDKLEKQAIEIEKRKKKGLAEPPKTGGTTGISEADQKLLKDLEARIKLEIDKEKTGKDKLEDLLNQKKRLRIKTEKLTFAEIQVLNAEHYKILNDALIDDTERTIQAEIDKYNRLTIEVGVGTKELFEAKKKMAQEQFLFELKEAERDEKTKNNKIENARTKYWKTLIDIDKEALDARTRLDQEKFNAQYQGTEMFFELQRQLELDNYAKQQADARLNNEQLEAIKQTHQKKLIAIDIAELQYKSDLEGRKADTEQENFTKVEDRFMESFQVIKDLNTRKYDDLRKQEDLAYQADLLAAGDNVKLKEQIEREHAAKMRQIGADEVEAKKQTTLAIQNVTQQFGQVIGQIGDLMMQEAQGRDKKMFEAGKKVAIAGIAIDKISAIASIITNTAIANAKAVAAFPLTLGQPWVTINTVSAGLSIAATIAAGISAISQLNGQKFEAAGSGTGGATSPGNQLGRNYEKGGIINGKRHAEGGTMIEAEKGEAIMTRGAVTAFSPLLSMMNQMGGGTSFTQGAVGQAGFDNPKVATPSQEQTPMIVKTYVVSTDMTSEQNKQARLKNLSTL